MIEAIRHILNFFMGKENSPASKFIMFVLILAVVLFLNNLFGFTFYYELKQKTALLKEFENLKEQRADNDVLVEFIDEAEQKVIERKNIVNGFIELFSREDFKPDVGAHRPDMPPGKDLAHESVVDTISTEPKTGSISDSTSLLEESDYSYEFQLGVNWDSIIDNCRPKESIVVAAHSTTEKIRYRSRLWHTVTSGILVIFLAIIIFILMLSVPFTSKKGSWLSPFVGILSAFPFMGLWLWLFQWLLGLIPVINNMPWINYLVNIGVNILIVIVIAIYFQRKEKKKEHKKREAWD